MFHTFISISGTASSDEQILWRMNWFVRRDPFQNLHTASDQEQLRCDVAPQAALFLIFYYNTKNKTRRDISVRPDQS
jgi:hypothetical protein